MGLSSFIFLLLKESFSSFPQHHEFELGYAHVGFFSCSLIFVAHLNSKASKDLGTTQGSPGKKPEQLKPSSARPPAQQAGVP